MRATVEINNNVHAQQLNSAASLYHSNSTQNSLPCFFFFSAIFLFSATVPSPPSPPRWRRRRHENQFSSGVFSANRESPPNEEIAPGDGRATFYFLLRIPPPPSWEKREIFCQRPADGVSGWVVAGGFSGGMRWRDLLGKRCFSMRKMFNYTLWTCKSL